MRVPFNSVFQVNPNGSISPKVPVSINGVTMTPGVTFTRGVSFGGIDLAALSARDLDVEVQGSLYVIKGYFA